MGAGGKGGDIGQAGSGGLGGVSHYGGYNNGAGGVAGAAINCTGFLTIEVINGAGTIHGAVGASGGVTYI